MTYGVFGQALVNGRQRASLDQVGEHGRFFVLADRLGNRGGFGRLGRLGARACGGFRRLGRFAVASGAAAVLRWVGRVPASGAGVRGWQQAVSTNARIRIMLRMVRIGLRFIVPFSSVKWFGCPRRTNDDVVSTLLDAVPSPPFFSCRRLTPAALGLQAQFLRIGFQELLAPDEASLKVRQLFQVDGIVPVEPLALQRAEDFLPVDVARARLEMTVD